MKSVKRQRVDVAQLQRRITREEFDYTVLISVLGGYAGPRQKIHELLRSRAIVRVKKGLYVFGPEHNRRPICRETLANLIFGPSCVSLEYALAYYGLIPERVETVTSVTPKKDKAFETPLGRFTYRYLAPAKYPYGIGQVWVDDAHPVLMASPAKALCDLVVLSRSPGLESAKEAREFLREDLRIDEAHWARIDRAELHALARVYRSRDAERIAEALDVVGAAAPVAVADPEGKPR